MNNSYVLAQQKRLQRKLHCTEFSKNFLWQQTWFSCCCDSPDTLLLAPVREVGPEPHSTTAATSNYWFAPPRGLVFAVYLAFCTLPVMNIPYCIAQVLSPRTQEAAILWQFCKTTLQRHCSPLLSPVLSSSWILLLSFLARTKEHLAPNQAGFITCYGNFHNTSIKIIGQNSYFLFCNCG